MSGRPGSSFMKRQKERARQEKQREKAERKRQRRLEKQSQPGVEPDWLAEGTAFAEEMAEAEATPAAELKGEEQ